MDFIQSVNIALGILCIIISVLLALLGSWFLWTGLKNRDRVSFILSIFIFALAGVAIFGAYSLFTSGIIRASPFMPR